MKESRKGTSQQSMSPASSPLSDADISGSSKEQDHISSATQFPSSTKNDSVIRVEKRGYYHCNESGNGAVFKDGRTVFLFDKPDLFYFVSSNFEHCKKGQRLMVDVMASHRRPLILIIISSLIHANDDEWASSCESLSYDPNNPCTDSWKRKPKQCIKRIDL
ncbi:hypothetical protein M5K25_023059 [Dendrobium thyrsiflorum]|uniref:Phytocyanin domain-containing protein n=1 Tax=Dendrobium thyrsiflorum TaxID=117978 RepID=A0ABD0U7C2_DENTH